MSLLCVWANTANTVSKNVTDSKFFSLTELFTYCNVISKGTFLGGMQVVLLQAIYSIVPAIFVFAADLRFTICVKQLCLRNILHQHQNLFMYCFYIAAFH